MPWMPNYELMLAWRDDPAGGAGKHCNVPRTTVYGGTHLGRWVDLQRRKMLQKTIGNVVSKLDPAQKQLLQPLVDSGELTLVFKNREKPRNWDEYYALLIAWRDDVAGGVHCNVPHNTIYQKSKLGEWLKEQRRQLRDESRNKLRGKALSLAQKSKLR